MDNNNPADPNSPSTGAPAMPASDPAQTPPSWSPPPSGAPTPIEALPDPNAQGGQILTDMTNTLPPQMTTTGPASSVETNSPDTFNMSPNQPPASPEAPAWGSPTNNMAQQPGAMTPQTSFDQPQSPLPDASTVSATPAAEPQAPNPMANNPFLQPNAGSAFSMPQTPIAPATSPLPDANAVAATPPAMAEVPAVPNPMAAPAPDPLNTAFAPTNAPGDNPFGGGSQDIIHDQTLPASGVVAAAAGAPVPGSAPSQPAAANPWDLPPMPPGAQQPADAIDPNTVSPTVGASPMTPTGTPIADPGDPANNPILNMGQPGAMPPHTPIAPPGQEGQIPQGEQSGPLDLSALTSNPPADPNSAAPGTSQTPEASAPATPAAPSNPLPQVPTENAPTDLSHLIAGDDPGGQNGVYTPPIAKDQNPAVTPVQPTPAAEGEAPPPGKHLNLTKVLLVAGIPIILIVAALSAYLILGVGQQAAPEESTSLPVEQTTQTQAPLTNPPQQIVAPSPATIPNPSTTLPTPTVSPVASGAATLNPSPAASLSPAMQAAQRQQAGASASPSSAGVSASASPASSFSQVDR